MYHEPGVAGSEALLAPLVSRLVPLGVDAELRPLNEALRDCRGDRVYLLMFARGGHWASLRDSCGVEPRVIPAWLSAYAIGRVAGLYGDRVVLLYRRARRFNGLYSEDVASIAARLRGMGFTVYTLEASRVSRVHMPRVDVIAPLSLLPGRLVDAAARAARLYGGVSLPAFALYAIDEIAAWLAGELIRA